MSVKNYGNIVLALEKELYERKQEIVLKDRELEELRSMLESLPEEKEESPCLEEEEKVRSVSKLSELRRTDPAASTLTTIFLRRTALYATFVIIFMVVLLWHRDGSQNYWIASILRDHFVAEEFDDKLSHVLKTYHDVGTIEEFWQFVKGPFVDQLYGDQAEWYNGQSLGNTFKSTCPPVLYQNVLLGAIQIRQVRVKSMSCSRAPERMHQVLPDYCLPEYSISEEEEDDRTVPSRSTIPESWVWRSQHALDGLIHWGDLGAYAGSGYVLDIPNNNRTEAESMIQNTIDSLWIDRATRAVFIDFTMYNPNVNVFAVARFLVEFPASGGTIPGGFVRAVNLFRYVRGTDYILLALEVIALFFVFFYVVDEIVQMFMEQGAYFLSLWNYVDILTWVMLLAVAGLRVKNILVAMALTSTFSQNHYVNFQPTAFWVQQESNIMAVCAFLVLFKLLRTLSIFPRMGMLGRTLEKALPNISSFMFMFFVVFLGFAVGLHVLVGNDLAEYRTVVSSMRTLFAAALGDFDMESVYRANRVFGPILIVAYMILVFFVLANVFIAILSSSFDAVNEQYRIGNHFEQGNRIANFVYAYTVNKYERFSSLFKKKKSP